MLICIAVVLAAAAAVAAVLTVVLVAAGGVCCNDVFCGTAYQAIGSSELQYKDPTRPCIASCCALSAGPLTAAAPHKLPAQ